MAEKIVKKSNEQLAVMNFEADAGAGREGADKEAYAIPFLGILQPLSPQIVEDLIPGAKAGQIFNTVTGDLYKELKVIPVAYARRFLLWEPRSNGGGFKGVLTPSEYDEKMASGAISRMQRMDDKGKPITEVVSKEGYLVRDTRHHYVLALNKDGIYEQALISMASTQVKRSKRWMTLISTWMLRGNGGKAFNPPSYARVYNVGAEKESNEKGTWFSWKVDPGDAVDDEQAYAYAKNFNKMIVEGSVKVDYAKEHPEAEVGDDKNAAF